MLLTTAPTFSTTSRTTLRTAPRSPRRPAAQGTATRSTAVRVLAHRVVTRLGRALRTLVSAARATPVRRSPAGGAAAARRAADAHRRDNAAQIHPLGLR
ncbi:hypothetical protein HDG69_002044 [Isoptericola halotolerans]|uniref:Uncharacterized protein n=1 Tax=Isoptericola halotolerans TaxID=300560 RepID=A0ABX2A3N6_9MICO|nr:hypothetical protein [Isoptericola halotolerans]